MNIKEKYIYHILKPFGYDELFVIVFVILLTLIKQKTKILKTFSFNC